MPSRTLSALPSCALLALLLLACDDATPRGGPGNPDASARSDASTLPDAAPPASDDAGADGPPDAPPVTGSITGRVTFDHRPIGRDGLGPVAPQPSVGVTVALLDGDTELARTTTDADGRFSFAHDGEGALAVRVVAAVADQALTTVDLDGAGYAFRADVVDDVADLHVTEDDFSGALAITATLRRGLIFAREAFQRATPFPPVAVHWEHGRVTPGGTSYAAGDELWILGGPEDTDEFDESVLLHELGHFLQHVMPISNWVPGNSHAGASTDPRLAWNEGWPSFFACAARDDGFYADSYGDRLGLGLDLDSLPTSGEYVANPGAPMSQTLSEWIIAGSVWELYTTGANRAQQRARSFGVLTGWFADESRDRAADGRELVDFLDGYLCSEGAADREVIQRYVVGERRFPYDLSPTCGKPGRPVAAVMTTPPPVRLPGRIIFDARGARLREIRVR